jgi:hypothetical protein
MSTPLSKTELEKAGFFTLTPFIFENRKRNLFFEYPIGEQDSLEGTFQGQFVKPNGNLGYQHVGQKISSLEKFKEYIGIYPYDIVVDHHTYSVDITKENRFFVVHSTPPYIGADNIIETGTFDWDPLSKRWTIIGDNKLSNKHTPDILTIILSKIKTP